MKIKLLTFLYLFILSGCMTINEETVKNYDSEKLCEFSNPWKWVTTKREEEIIDSELCSRGKYCCNENERTSMDNFEGRRNWGQKNSKENKEQLKENNAQEVSQECRLASHNAQVCVANCLSNGDNVSNCGIKCSGSALKKFTACNP